MLRHVKQLNLFIRRKVGDETPAGYNFAKNKIYEYYNKKKP